MKTNTFQKKEYKFTADLWKFTDVTDSAGKNVRTYSFDRSITLLAQSGMFGYLKVFFPNEYADIIVGHQLYNFCDAAGTELQTNAVWQIDQVIPDLNPWGVREGFTGRVNWIALDG